MNKYEKEHLQRARKCATRTVVAKAKAPGATYTNDGGVVRCDIHGATTASALREQHVADAREARILARKCERVVELTGTANSGEIRDLMSDVERDVSALAPKSACLAESGLCDEAEVEVRARKARDAAVAKAARLEEFGDAEKGVVAGALAKAGLSPEDIEAHITRVGVEAYEKAVKRAHKTAAQWQAAGVRAGATAGALAALGAIVEAEVSERRAKAQGTASGPDAARVSDVRLRRKARDALRTIVTTS